MTQPEWPGHIAHVIGEQVQRYRGERGLSARRLSEECGKAGLDISRSTIADLENGRRATVSVAELLVLSAVLSVPAVKLLFPLDLPKVEPLPGRKASPWAAWREFTGEGSPESMLLHRYDLAERRLRGAVGELGASRDKSIGSDTLMRTLLRDALAEFVSVRQQITNQGLAAPGIPDDLSKQLSEVAGDISDATRS